MIDKKVIKIAMLVTGGFYLVIHTKTIQNNNIPLGYKCSPVCIRSLCPEKCSIASNRNELWCKFDTLLHCLFSRAYFRLGICLCGNKK